MRNLSLNGKASKFEIALFSPSIRTAMRLGGVFLGSGRVVGFRLPAEANLAVYRESAVAILAETKLSFTYVVCNVHINRRGDTDTEDAQRVLRSKDGVLVLIPHGAELPIEFLLNFDVVVDVGHVKPRHVASALKEVLGLNVSSNEADELAAYPLRVWVPAMRPGRTLKYVLSKLREVNNRPAPRTWTPKIEELAGYGEAADWVLELAKDLDDWRAGRIAWRDLDTGLLLSGPPGTGKTIFSQAAARTCELNVVLASSAQWQAKGHLGDMLAAMRKSFADALAKAPSILFIDEIDAIGDRRSFTGYNANYSSQVVNALLELIDGAEERQGVILIGATNYPEKIDPALLRAGRLGRHVSIPLPDKEARSRILSFHLEGVLQPGQLADAAMVTTGYSGADLEQVAKSAKRVARREGRALVVDDVMQHLPPKVSLTEAERYSACIHEAGHAV